MKKILAIISASLMLCSCYEDYVKDFDYSAAYFTYQYDIRTFVLGENESFDITVCLAGVMNNKSDRIVKVVQDNELLTTDLGAMFGPAGTAASTATSVFTSGSAVVGKVFDTSISKDFTAGGAKSITALPDNYYDVNLSGMKFAKGDGTAVATIKATKAIQDDPSAFKPYYGLGFKIVNADVDTVLMDRSFLIVVARCENKLYGNWYHGGSNIVKDASGKVVSENKYAFAIPQEDGKVYTLTTVNANTVKTNKYVQNSGSLNLTFNGNDITITSDSIQLVNDGRKSSWNGAEKIQDREIYLNYTYRNADGGTTEVSDILYFRNRTRDGINEWQN